MSQGQGVPAAAPLLLEPRALDVSSGERVQDAAGEEIECDCGGGHGAPPRLSSVPAAKSDRSDRDAKK